MEAEIIDIESLRSRRGEIRRAEALAFGRLPCPRCDGMTVACDVAAGSARYHCDGDGCHEAVEWTYDGASTVADQNGRIRKYFSY
ncbi:hypothetical protein G6L37_00715 [Agrobacterium rubi]|nr:hypothetical protein [Agrobacterium rubi]NTF23912.1 hypothetical protein [Agrobacterium rubi]